MMESRYLRHISLAAVYEGDIAQAGNIPPQLFDRVESACANFFLGSLDEDKPTQQVAQEASEAIDGYLSFLVTCLRDATAAGGYQRQAAQDGRLYAAVDRYIPAGFEGHEFKEALRIYQLDNLIGLYREGRFDDALLVIDDLLEIEADIESATMYSWHDADNEAQLSQTQRDRARKRHKENNEQRAAALAEWESNGASYSSAAGFARYRHKHYGVTERTLGDWIREHRKTKA